MKQSKRSTTAEIKGGGFKSHGRMELEASGRLNILEATGPFNLELVVAADAAQDPLYKSLQSEGSWGTVLIFRESALISFDALAAITKSLSIRRSQGYAPVAVALVFGSNVEGGAFMSSHYLKAYENAGVVGRIFSDEEEAKEWLSQLLGSQ